MAFKRHGDPTKVIQKQYHGLTLRQRFDVYTRKKPGCWDWVGYRDPNGYGRIDVDDRPMLAHRLAYLVHYGSIPGGKNVLHKCDNPQCVNPEHLFLGTQADNVRDMHEKGRARKRALRGPEHGMAKLNEKKVRAIRAWQGPLKDIAAQYGITATTACDVRKRKTWKHIE
jgi:hypothetical protein